MTLSVVRSMRLMNFWGGAGKSYLLPACVRWVLDARVRLDEMTMWHTSVKPKLLCLTCFLLQDHLCSDICPVSSSVAVTHLHYPSMSLWLYYLWAAAGELFNKFVCLRRSFKNTACPEGHLPWTSLPESELLPAISATWLSNLPKKTDSTHGRVAA